MTFKYEGRGWWPYSERIDSPPQTPLYSVLRWILNQLNMGCAEFIGEGDNPSAHTVVLGQRAAYYSSAKEASEEAQKRSLAVNFAGIFAKARERGIEPEYEELVEKAVRLANENAKMNTEFHYAFEQSCPGGHGRWGAAKPRQIMPATNGCVGRRATGSIRAVRWRQSRQRRRIASSATRMWGWVRGWVSTSAGSTRV